MVGIDINLSMSQVGRRPEKVLLVAYYEPRNVPSIVENIALLQRLSSFSISVLNLAEHRVDSGFLKIPPVVDLNDFEAVVIHNTVSYNVDNLRSLDQAISGKLATFDGAKVILKQDEHFRFSEFISYASDVGIDCIFSIMPQNEVARTYGSSLPETTIRHMLTSYVTPSMRSRFNPSTKRPIDIGYRGSIMPLSFGRLCYQKRQIGEEVLQRLAGSELVLDISSRWEDRVGGEAWFDFLASCKSVLGVESGSGLFDVDGTLAARCAAVEGKLGADDGSRTYAEAYLAELSPLEGRVGYFMISPRHFEAISVGAIQILFPGTYTERMISGRHYFELAEDYSNLDEGIDLTLDSCRRNRMAAAAFEEVLLDKRNWIETFVEEFDAGLLFVLDSKGRRRKPVLVSEQPSRNVVLLQCHDFGADPRRDTWYAMGAPDGVLIHHLGINEAGSEVAIRKGPKSEVIVHVPRKQWAPGCLAPYIAQVAPNEGASRAVRELYFLAEALNGSDVSLFQIFGMPQRSPYAENFRWYLSYILSSALTLVDAISRVEGVHALVAINFPSLLPALIAKGLLGVPVIYEALEYWPEADPDQGEFARVFWRQLEDRLVRFADHHGTVSSPLARLLTREFGTQFYSVPNCTPTFSRSLSGTRPTTRASAQRDVRFLFQGNFAPYRGLEQLIRNWTRVDSRAVLVLRGPDNTFRQQMIELARSLGLCEFRVMFPPAVPTELLIAAAEADGDVGLVPYTPAGANYANCSPNKLSQYMSAGLPILANATNFVTEVVVSAKSGLVVDFNSETKLVEAVSKLCDDSFRQSCGVNALDYFERSFNWAAVSAPFYAAVHCAVGNSEETHLLFYQARPESNQGSRFNASSVTASASSIRVRLAHESITYKVLRRVWRSLPSAARLRLRDVRERVVRKPFP